ncbi:MAG TPA: S49 family peptidase [Candidatus Megaira endosymbiont of Hartmannula sinica]|nr:S49 family peptidase [Candidatus Megaera endosymbiont of Hartmannula sinica]
MDKSNTNKKDLTSSTSVVAATDSDIIQNSNNKIFKKSMHKIFSYIPFINNKKKKNIAILRIDGVIGKVGFKGGITISSINKTIEDCFKIKDLELVCMVINCPGGSPVQTELIAKKIKLLAKKRSVLIYCFVEDVAASGGYWIASIADKIFATKSSIIGSIGVISSSFGFNKMIEKIGIERRIHTQGNNKSVLDPFRPQKEEDTKIIKNIQKNIHDHFIDHVKNHRSNKLTQDDEIIFNGMFWSGERALDYGLIDEIGDLYSYLYSKYGEDNINIHYVENKGGWFKKKLGLSTIDNESRVISNIIDIVDNKLFSNKYNLK